MQANVKTLSVRLGVKRVFWACIVLLELAYAGAIGLGVLSQVRQVINLCDSCCTRQPDMMSACILHSRSFSCACTCASMDRPVGIASAWKTKCNDVQVWWSKIVTVGVHFLLGAFLLRHAQQVDLHDPKSITASYMLIWKLFYSEYLLIPFFR